MNDVKPVQGLSEQYENRSETIFPTYKDGLNEKVVMSNRISLIKRMLGDEIGVNKISCFGWFLMWHSLNIDIYGVSRQLLMEVP